MGNLKYLVPFSLLIFLLIPTGVVADFPVQGTYQDVFSGSPQSFNQYDDKVVLVEAFATWCKGCDAELYELSRVKNTFGSNITILSLSVDPTSDTPNKILQFKSDAEDEFNFEATWNFGLDNEGNFLDSYSVSILPTTFLFSAEGTMENKWEGPVQANEIISYIDANITIPDPSISNLLLQLTNNTFFRITLISLILALVYKIFVPSKGK